MVLSDNQSIAHEDGEDWKHHAVHVHVQAANLLERL